MFAKTKFRFGLGLFFLPRRRKSVGSLGLPNFTKQVRPPRPQKKDRCGLAQFGLARDTPTETSAERDAQRITYTSTSTKERKGSAFARSRCARQSTRGVWDVFLLCVRSKLSTARARNCNETTLFNAASCAVLFALCTPHEEMGGEHASIRSPALSENSSVAHHM